MLFNKYTAEIQSKQGAFINKYSSYVSRLLDWGRRYIPKKVELKRRYGRDIYLDELSLSTEEFQ